jgi:predicted nucleic acid-binding protein
MRLFLDANVLFSAAYREGNAVELLFAVARAKLCSLLGSPFVMEEARRNIAAKKPERLQALEILISELMLVAEPPPGRMADMLRHGLPAKDAPVLAAAVFARADALITGDRAHFGHLYGTVVEGTRVLTIAMVLEQLTAN